MVPNAVLDELGGLSSPSVANAIETFDVRPRDAGVTNGSLTYLTPGLGVAVGYAATMRITSHGGADLKDNVAKFPETWKHALAQPAPRIMVVEDVDDPPAAGAYWGEVNANIHRALGCIGVITNGAVRDLPEMEATGFRVFGGPLAVSHTYVRILDVGVPVKIADLTIEPGDLLHADIHGVVKVPTELAAEIPVAARAIEANERRMIAFCRSPEFDVTALATAMGLDGP